MLVLSDPVDTRRLFNFYTTSIDVLQTLKRLVCLLGNNKIDSTVAFLHSCCID